MVPTVTAFVAGATGYTGREVVRVLRERGARAVAHVRPDSPDLAAWRERFAALGAETDTTPWREEAMTGTLRRRRPTHLLALLGTTNARRRDAGRASAVADTYEAVDYGLTALLLRAAVASGTGPRVIYLSAIGAREDTRNAYLRARGRVERELRGSGLPHVIVRPSFITGPDRDETRPAERLAALATDAVAGVLARVGVRAAARWRSVSGRELAEGLVRLALAPGLERRVVHRDAL